LRIHGAAGFAGRITGTDHHNQHQKKECKKLVFHLGMFVLQTVLFINYFANIHFISIYNSTNKFFNKSSLIENESFTFKASQQ